MTELNERLAKARISPTEFVKLPVEERRKFLQEQVNDPEIIQYYQDVWSDECAMQDKGMME
jgi:hypothetical protein